MKRALISLFLCAPLCTFAQLINQQFNQQTNQHSAQCGISTTELQATIIASAVYRAKPDGYHILFTTSFISKTVEDVEATMNAKMDKLINGVKSLNIYENDVVVDVISMDPIFQTTFSDDAKTPMGYKITENITFNVAEFETIRALVKKCLEFGIYDIVYVKPYILNAKPIYDSLANKTIEILDFKKDVCEKVGRSLSGGTVTFSKCKNVFYPSDSYLKSLLRNGNIYMHSIDQNSEVNVVRNVEVDAYNAIDLNQADFIFHADETTPVIQFYYQINYVHTMEKPKKDEEEDEGDKEKVFYILDKEGNLKKFEF